jgi:competence protein ComEA
MALGLSRREQWTLIGVVGVILAGIGVGALHRPGGELGVETTRDATGRWERLAQFPAGQTPPSIRAGDLLTSPTNRTGQTGPTQTPTGGLDLNRATAPELEHLPGIGPVRARDIITYRDSIGGFASVEQLTDIRGIGPATLERLRPYVFVAPPAADPSSTMTLPASAPARGFGLGPASATPVAISTAPPIAPTPAPALTATPPPRINVNTASYEELQKITGIGPVLARRIIEDRQRNGRYRSPTDLERVSGIGPVTLQRMLPQITVEER